MKAATILMELVEIGTLLVPKLAKCNDIIVILILKLVIKDFINK